MEGRKPLVAYPKVTSVVILQILKAGSFFTIFALTKDMTYDPGGKE